MGRLGPCPPLLHSRRSCSGRPRDTAGGPHGPLPARGGWGKLQHNPGDAPALPPHIKADFHARFDFSPDLPVNYLLIVIVAEDIYIMEPVSYTHLTLPTKA